MTKALEALELQKLLNAAKIKGAQGDTDAFNAAAKNLIKGLEKAMGRKLTDKEQFDLIEQKLLGKTKIDSTAPIWGVNTKNSFPI
jgi:hypothetical protein